LRRSTTATSTHAAPFPAPGDVRECGLVGCAPGATRSADRLPVASALRVRARRGS
jgi:hypothetical protein